LFATFSINFYLQSLGALLAFTQSTPAAIARAAPVSSPHVVVQPAFGRIAPRLPLVPRRDDILEAFRLGSALEDGACERQDSSERWKTVAPRISWKKIDSGNRKQMHFWLLPKRMAAQKKQSDVIGFKPVSIRRCGYDRRCINL
jgi:hypothetical protein